MSVFIPHVRDSSDAELKVFDTVCEQMHGFDNALNYERVDGFLTAVAAGPVPLAVADWLPALCGDAFERAFADPSAAAAAERALVNRLKVISAQLEPGVLMDRPDQMRLNPLMVEWTEAQREELVKAQGLSAEEAQLAQTGAEWADGFLSCVEAFQHHWAPPADEDGASALDALLDQVMVLTFPPGDPLYAEHVAKYWPQGAPSREDLVGEAFWAVQDLRVLWVDHAPKPETRRVEAAPGRNDPCPCGSGKKFKKCHGAAA
jgi:uncharacterized protein